MKAFIHAALAAVLAQNAFAEVAVDIRGICDNRTTGNAGNGHENALEVSLMLSGPELIVAKGLRIVLKTATDDTGKALLQRSDGFEGRDGFEELHPAPGRKQPDEFCTRLLFENPPRAAKMVKVIEGSIELNIPARDSAAVVTAGVTGNVGKPLENAGLKAAGVQFSILKPDTRQVAKGDTLTYEFVDPAHQMTAVVFCDVTGNELKSQVSSTGWGSPDGRKNVTVQFSGNLATDAVVKIYLVTEKSLLTVPFVLKDIALP